MSHLKERVERNCLNCNAQVAGKYCHICGQENIHPQESVWHLVNHFFQDITHFDGKFFNTLKLLIWRPGFLPAEYLLGRRTSYINPVRMYVFTSAFFFLIFFSLTPVTEKGFNKNVQINGKTVEEARMLNSAAFNAYTAKINNGAPMSRQGFEKYSDSVLKISRSHFLLPYSSRGAYDSILAKGEKHGWLKRQLIYKVIEEKDKYHDNANEFLSVFLTALMHSFPQMLFISLPLFALLLKLLYVRRKQYYYVSHGIFSIHLYIFAFIVLIFIFGFNWINDLVRWHWLKNISTLLGVLIFFYQYKAMRNFYEQGRVKTITKFVVLNFLSFFMIIILFAVFSFFSLMKV